jgi:hypothetical protein
MVDPVLFNSLRRFRAGVYGAYGARRDALFELLDAATVAGPVPSLAHYGQVRVRAWADMHAMTQNHPTRGSRRSRLLIRGTLVLVEVERLPRQTRIPKQL